jgi:GntR family transcriptional regulator, galactonate operon transcriptional repressor
MKMGRATSSQQRSYGLAGVIEVRGILGTAVSGLGTRIVGGEWQPGDGIPKEADLCNEMGVSRSVIREAFRILGAKGLIRSRTSDGTRVQPRSEWRLLDPDVMDWRIKAGDTKVLLEDLLKVRLVLEPGVVHTATLMASPTSRARVAAAWAAKQHVYQTQDPQYAVRRARFIEADLEFHRALLAAVESDLLSQLFAVIEAALSLLLDLQMNAVGYRTEMIGMEESQELHEAVFVQFEKGEAFAAEAAMRRLIERAIRDAQRGFAALGG